MSIKLKRGLKQNLPQLAEGEPGFTTDTHELFIGSAIGNIGMARSVDLPDLSVFQSSVNGLTQCQVSYNGISTTFLNQTTTLYVAPDSTVVSGNDGLSSGKPIKLSDIQTIFNALKVAFPILMGTWIVNLAAGTYQSVGMDNMLYLTDIRSVDYIQFNGADVGVLGTVPTTILDGKLNGSTYAHGMYFQNMMIQAKNIKFQNFTESTTPVTNGTRGGLVFSGTSGKILAYNVHAYNCSWGGIVNQGIPKMYVQGGRFEYCRYGINSLYNTTVTIGYNGSPGFPDSQNTNFYNCTEAGVQLQSQTNGHVDYCIFDSNTNKALVITTSSEINSVSSIFRNNNVALSVQSGSRWLNTSNTFTNNTQEYEQFYSGEVQQTGTDSMRKRNVGTLIEGTNNFLLTAPSGGGTVFTQVIPANTLHGRGKTFNAIVYGRFENLSTNTSILNIKATDGTNTVTMQSVSLGSTSGYQAFKLEFFLSEWTAQSFYYNSDFVQAGSSLIPYNNAGFTLDSTKDITITFELAVTGTAANTVMNIYRTIPRVIL